MGKRTEISSSTGSKGNEKQGSLRETTTCRQHLKTAGRSPSARRVVVGLVGAGGLGTLLALQLAAFDYRGVLATLLALIILTFAVDIPSSVLRRSLR